MKQENLGEVSLRTTPHCCCIIFCIFCLSDVLVCIGAEHLKVKRIGSIYECLRVNDDQIAFPGLRSIPQEHKSAYIKQRYKE